MKTLPANLVIEKNRLHSPDPWLILLEITLTDGTILRFARNTEDVIFGTTIPESCIAFWKMNDNAPSAVVIDTMGNHNGTYKDGGGDINTDTGSVLGKINRALDFDGDEFIHCPHDSDLNMPNFVAISAWLKTSSTARMSIVNKHYTDYEFVIEDNDIKMYYGNSGGVQAGTVTTAFTLADDSWHHVVVQCYKSEGILKAWLDGDYVGSDTDSPSIGNTENNLQISGRAASQFFVGSIDDIMIFSTELSEEEIAALWNKGNGTECPGAKYTAFPFEIEPTKQTSKGEIPTLTVRVSNITRLIQPYLEALDGGIGSIVKITVVNSAHLSENYSELEMTFDVLACDTSAEWVTFTLGAPNPLRQRFPLHKYLALHCRWTYKLAECGYVGKAISGITKANPGVVTSTAHGFATDDYIYHDDVEGMVEVNGQTYQITKLTDDTYSIVDTSGFTGYTGGGIAGYSACKRILEDCREHENAARFGGFVGMRSSGIRIV